MGFIMQPRNDEQKPAKLFRLAVNIGNTTQFLLEIAKTMLRNGHKLFNTNVVLRRYVANDINLSKIKANVKTQVPSISRDREVAENIINKYRMVAGIENKAKIDQFYNRLERLSKEADNYEAQRQALQKQIAKLIDEHPKNIQDMIDNMKDR
jgi:hypothetical protein